MRNFCGQCGRRLDSRSGLCSKCDSARLRKRKWLLPMLLILALAMVGIFAFPKAATPALPEESSVPETTQIAQWPQVELVTDAFFDDTFAGIEQHGYSLQRNPFYYHIPQINLNLPGIKKINADIYQELYEMLSVDGFPEQAPFTRCLAYTVGEKEDIISILVCAYDRFYSGYTEDGQYAQYGDDHYYIVYNVNRKTGEYVTDAELLELYGYTPGSFRDSITGALTSKTHEFFMNNGMFSVSENITQEDEWTQDWYIKLWNQSISDEYKNKVMPYIDAATGDLCIAATIPVINTDGIEGATMNLTGTSEPADPETYRDVTVQWS